MKYRPRPWWAPSRPSSAWSPEVFAAVVTLIAAAALLGGVGYWYWSDKVESMMLRCEMYAATEKAAKEVRTAWEKH